jgi:hypothetical protein
MNRQEIRVLTRDGTVNSIANVNTELVRHTMDGSDGTHICSECFVQGVVTGEDYMKVTWDKGYTAKGKLRISRRSCFEVIVDPNAVEYDLNLSARFLIDRYWVDKQAIHAQYPGSEEKISASSYSHKGGPDPVEDLMSYFYGDEYDDEDTPRDAYETSKQKTKYRYLVREFWWRTYEKAARWTDLQTNEEKILTSEKDMSRAKKATDLYKGRFEYQEFLRTTLNKAIIVGDVLLEHEENPMGEDATFFPFVRYSPYWDDGYAFGVVDNLIGPQREENINRTQATRLLNQSANAGWIVKKLAAGYRAILEMFGAVPGVVIEKDQCGGEVERITPAPLSNGHVTLSERSSIDMKEISGINDAVQGYDTGRAESGRAINLKQKQGVMTAEMMMDNYRASLKLLGTMLVQYFRTTNVYTDAELKEIMSVDRLLDMQLLQRAERDVQNTFSGMGLVMPVRPPAPDPVLMQRVGPQVQRIALDAFKEASRTYDAWSDVVKQQAVTTLLEEWNSAETQEYNIVVDLSPEAPTTQLASLLEMVEINRMWPGSIPPDVAIKASSIPNKDEIISKLQSMMPPSPGAVPMGAGAMG